MTRRIKAARLRSWRLDAIGMATAIMMSPPAPKGLESFQVDGQRLEGST
jgi:hypothetical protein